MSPCKRLPIWIGFLTLCFVSGNSTNAFAVDIAARPEWPLIEAVRRSPWDESAVMALVQWYADRDPPRSELMKLQMQLSQTDPRDPAYAAIETRTEALLKEHRERWTAPLKEFGLRKRHLKIELGLIDTVHCKETTDEQLAILMQVPEIRELQLESPKLSIKGFRQLVKMPQLDSLSIGPEPIFPFHWQTLETLPPWTKIRVFGREQDRKAEAQMNARRLARFDELSKEEQFRASVRFVSTFDGGIRFGRRPQRANLTQAGITDLEMKLLAPLTDLTDVFISESGITSQGLAHLAGMKDLTRLGLFDTKVETIEPLAGLRKLESLHLFPREEKKVGDAGVAAIENFTELTSLELFYSGISDVTVRRLAKLTKLQKLILEIKTLNDPECLSVLSGLTELRELELMGPSVPDSTFEYLKGMSKLECLKVTIARGPGHGFQHLSGLEKLNRLSVSGRGVTDLGLQHLSKLTGLEMILAGKTRVTKIGARELAAKLPHVTIHLDDAVVKSPRDKYILNRQRMKSVSLLLPQHWEKSRDSDGSSLSAEEDGFEGIAGATEIRLDSETHFKSPEEAVNDHLKGNVDSTPKVVERDIVKLPNAKNVVSCIYTNEDDQRLIVAFESPDGVTTLRCGGDSSRFAEFRMLFNAVAESIRVDPKPEAHADETVELPGKTP